MRLTSAADWLELSEATFPAEARGTQAEEDILLSVAVKVRGFSAEDQAWVTRADWEGFTRAFRRLEAERLGEAVLLGASPDELRLRFYVLDSAGHTAVEGSIAQPHYPARELGWLRLSFSLAFDAGQLRDVLEEFSTYGSNRQGL